MADFLTVCAALLLLFGFSFLFWFIRRLGILEMEAATMTDQFQRPKPEPQPMVEVKNPFKMTVSSTRMLGCVELIVSCIKPCHISGYWKVKKQCLDKMVCERNIHENEGNEECDEHNVQSLHTMLVENCDKIIASDYTEKCSGKQLLYNIEDLTKSSSTSNNEIQLYDLVISMELPVELRESVELPSNITAMLTGIVVKQQNETFKPQLVEHFIQIGDGKLFKLKRLFLEDGSSDEQSPSAQEQRNELCIVCQTLPISRALIPCGHACLCSLCFDKMNTCPMCRQPMTSSFVLREEPNLNRDNSYEFSEILKRMNPIEVIKGIYSAS